MNNYNRGNLFYANLNPSVGSEQGGFRPVLIIQNEKGNKHSPTVIIAPLTNVNNYKQNIPTHVLLDVFDRVKYKSIILLEQIRVIDKNRLKDYLGTVDKFKMKEVDTALAIAVGLKERGNI